MSKERDDERDLTEDAVRYNAPRYFGRDLVASIGASYEEIVPVSDGKPLRRAKARPGKV